MRNPVPTVTKHPVSIYRDEYILTLDGVELRVQLHPFSQDDINDAVALFLKDGTVTPRHKPTFWGDRFSAPRQKLPGGGELMDPIVYDGLYLED